MQQMGTPRAQVRTVAIGEICQRNESRRVLIIPESLLQQTRRVSVHVKPETSRKSWHKLISLQERVVSNSNSDRPSSRYTTNIVHEDLCITLTTTPLHSSAKRFVTPLRTQLITHLP